MRGGRSAALVGVVVLGVVIAGLETVAARSGDGSATSPTASPTGPAPAPFHSLDAGQIAALASPAPSSPAPSSAAPSSAAPSSAAPSSAAPSSAAPSSAAPSSAASTAPVSPGTRRVRLPQTLLGLPKTAAGPDLTEVLPAGATGAGWAATGKAVYVAAGPASIVSGTLAQFVALGATASALGTGAFTAQPSGPLGGDQLCSTGMVGGAAVDVCLFRDDSVFGLAVFRGLGDTGTVLGRIRSTVEQEH